ncbi:MAG: hypothetical protein DMG07_18255 [Acidobacteria bacterium]|nr:MAG: hypothetical protein DMG07_18255 [Acidobacteriota bacterium]
MGKALALLIPGLDGTGRLYYRQIERLSARYRVRPWEFRQAGRFDDADLVGELARATGGEPPATIVVVGESFGGTVAMHFALACPDRVGTLMLVAIGLACRLSALLSLSAARAVKDLVAERTLALEGIPAEDRRRYREIVRAVDLAAYRRRLELARAVDLRARLDEIQARTLLFASGRDKIVPSLAEARFMASRIPRAELHEFPRAGHALLLTPEFFLADYL